MSAAKHKVAAVTPCATSTTARARKLQGLTPRTQLGIVQVLSHSVKYATGLAQFHWEDAAATVR